MARPVVEINMKYSILLPFIVLSFFSCTKTGSPTSPPPPALDSLLKSYTIYMPSAHIKQEQFFSFDRNSQLASAACMARLEKVSQAIIMGECIHT